MSLSKDESDRSEDHQDDNTSNRSITGEDSDDVLNDPPQKKRFASFLIVFITSFIDLAGFGMLLPLILYYYEAINGIEGDGGKSDTHTGMIYGAIVGCFSLGQFVGGFGLGVISDKYGRRPAILISLSGSIVFFILTGFATNTISLIFFRFLSGLFASATGICSSYIADSTTEAERPKFMGLLGAAIGLGLIGGPVIGGTLGTLLGVTRAFPIVSFISAGVCFINLCIAAVFFKESEKFTIKREKIAARKERRAARKKREEEKLLIVEDETSPLIKNGSSNNYTEEEEEESEEEEDLSTFSPKLLKQVFSQDILLRLLLVGFVNQLVQTVVETCLVILLKEKFDVKESYMGPMFAIYGIIVAVTQSLIFPFMSRFIAQINLLRFGILSCGIFAGLLPVIPKLWALMLVVACSGISYSLLMPAFSILYARISKGLNGSVYGLSRSINALARFSGPFMSGVLYDIHIKPIDHALPFWLSVGFAILGFLMLLFVKKPQSTYQEIA